MANPLQRLSRSVHRAVTGTAIVVTAALLGPGAWPSGGVAGQTPASRTATTSEPQALHPGEARIWYLGHCGFAVRTARHLLIFDYQERRDGPVPREHPADGGLDRGWIDPAEIRNDRVRVFVTHSHQDHFDPVVLERTSAAADVQYFFGWSAMTADRTHHMLEGPRATSAADGLEITTINSHHSGVPEVAFLVRVDGLVIYHNGDYQGAYEADYPYLQKVAAGIDLAFVPGVSREGLRYTDQNRDLFERFRPKAVFPMHAEAGAQMYKEFANAFRQRVPGLPVMIPERLGQRFDYRGAGR